MEKLMFIPFRVKTIREDSNKEKLSDLGIPVTYEEEEFDEVIIEVNLMHVVSIEPFKNGYMTSLTNGSELFTDEHPLRIMHQGVFN